jgi:hypothetical protein
MASTWQKRTAKCIDHVRTIRDSILLLNKWTEIGFMSPKIHYFNIIT